MTSFDAHDYAKRLIAAGASAAEADVHAEALTQVADEVASLEKRVDTQQCKAESTGACLAAQVSAAHAAQDVKLTELDKKITDAHAELDQKITNVHAELDQKITHVHAELDKKITNVHAELDKKITNVHAELVQRIVNVRAELIEKMEKMHADLCIKIVQSKWESLRWTLGIVLSVAWLQTGVTVALLRWLH